MKRPSERGLELSRRQLLKHAALLAGIGATSNVESFAQAVAGARGAAPASGSTLILLGTQGGPNVNLTRSETACAIVVNGQPYLIDCGYGTLRQLVQAGIRFNDVTNVFLTHLHDDHTADLPALLSHKWTGTAANPKPTTVHGPFGTTAMVEGAMAFFKANIEIRTVDEGRTVKPENIFHGHDVAAPTVTDVFRDERVTVKAIENDHFPDRAKEKMPYRSFAYRFNMADRSIVFSGDTPYSKRLVELAQGADILVCEVLGTAAGGGRGNAAVDTNTESVARHVRETHSPPEDVGRMATEAKVKTVVLYHIVGANGPQGENNLIEGVRRSFSGEVIVGHDQLKL
jgi:ribonuclease BN (tRNA processing enzyme)